MIQSQRIQSTPVIAKGATYDGWFADAVAAPAVCWDGSRFVMTLSLWNTASGKWATAFFTSDNLTAWNYVSGSLQDPGANQLIGNSGIAWFAGKYWWCYQNYASGNDSTAYLSSSTNLTTWTSGVAIVSGSQADDPSLIVNPNTNKLECWYGQGNFDSSRQFHYSDSSDGVSWTARGQIYASSAWSIQNYGAPQAYYDGSKRYLTFDCASIEGVRLSGLAVSDGTGSNFTSYGTHLGPNPLNEWESINVFDCCCVGRFDRGDGHGEVLWFVYAGSDIAAPTDNTNSSVGLAYLSTPLVTTNTTTTMSATFSHWETALNRVLAGTGDARILTVGDSITGGYGSTNTTNYYRTGYPAKLAALIGSMLSLPVSSSGIAPGAGGITNTEWTLGSGFTQIATFGFDNITYSTTPGSVLTYAPPAASDTYDVYYLSSSTNNAIFTIGATGGSPITVANNSTGSNAVSKATVHAGSVSSSNVVTVTHVSGGDGVFIVAIEPRKSSTSQILVANVGVGGSTSVDWTSGVSYYNGVASISAYAPDLTIIMFGPNDAAANVSNGALSANLLSLVTAAKASGDVIICSVVPSSSSTGATLTAEQGYETSVYSQLAAAQSCGFADVWAAFGGAYNAPDMYDLLHPNDAGYVILAQTVFAVLPAASAPPTPPATPTAGGRALDLSFHLS